MSMRQEELFSRSGYYRFLLDSNVLLHREAAAAAVEELEPIIGRRSPDETLEVLDLACGGWPTAIAGVMGAFPERSFAYTGIDINPDQVELAISLFEFPSNVASIRVLEGNAWDPDSLAVGGEYDLIFSGMNLHHGNPQELLYLSRQLRGLLDSDGLLFSHDVFRPDEHPYRRRPDLNPDNSAESFRLVEEGRITAAGAPDIEIEEDTGNAEPVWRADYLERMRRILIARGGDLDGTGSTIAHMTQRDFPVSTRELSQILVLAGFTVRVRRFDGSEEPLGPYVACCAAWSDS